VGTAAGFLRGPTHTKRVVSSAPSRSGNQESKNDASDYLEGKTVFRLDAGLDAGLDFISIVHEDSRVRRVRKRGSCIRERGQKQSGT
jgi:hypothetical protein